MPIERQRRQEPITPFEAGTEASAALQWRPIARFVDAETALGERASAAGPVQAAAYEFLRFGIKQGWACIFGASLLALLILTRLTWPAHSPIARYDALFAAAVLLQALLLYFKMETWSEARVILIFHMVGTVMEIHKTAIGSWVYPEASIFRIGGVPLFTGFMYAAVGSYLARVWRLFDFRFSRHPNLTALSVLSFVIYANFLTDHLGYDLRYGLIAVTALLLGPTTIYFKVWRRHRHMPLLLGCALVTLFIWIAENIGTITGTWLYPNQMQRWTTVSTAKFTSWFLLMIISYTLVARAHGIVRWRGEAETPVAIGTS